MAEEAIQSAQSQSCGTRVRARYPSTGSERRLGGQSAPGAGQSGQNGQNTPGTSQSVRVARVVRMRANRAKTNEQGFILVTILLVIAVLFPLILAFNAKVQLNLIQAENFRNSVQALRIARSGVEGAIGILKADDASYDAKTDKWAAAFPSLALGDGILNVMVVDEDGKIPINNLVVAVKTARRRPVQCRRQPQRPRTYHPCHIGAALGSRQRNACN